LFVSLIAIFTDSNFKFHILNKEKNNTESIENNEEFIKNAQKIFIFLIGFEDNHFDTNNIEHHTRHQIPKAYQDEISNQKLKENAYLGKLIKKEGQINCNY